MFLKDKKVYGFFDNDRQPAVKLVFDDKEEAELVFNSIQKVLKYYEDNDILDEDNEEVLARLKRYYKETDTYENNMPSTMVFSHMFKKYVWAFIKLSIYI